MTTARSLLSVLNAIPGPWKAITAGAIAAYKATSSVVDAHREAALEAQKLGEKTDRVAKAMKEARDASANSVETSIKGVQDTIDSLTNQLRTETLGKSSLFEREKETLSGWWGAAKGWMGEMVGIHKVMDNSLSAQLEAAQAQKKALERNLELKRAAEAGDKDAAVQLAERLKLLEAERKIREGFEASAKAAAAESARLTAEFERLKFDELLPQDQVKSLQAELAQVTAQLRAMGLAAKSPAEAFEASMTGWSEEQKAQIQALILGWATLEKSVAKTENEIAEAARNRAAEMAQLIEQIAELQRTIPKLTADLEDLKAAGNDFVKVQSRDWRDDSITEAWYRRQDTTQNVEGNTIAVPGASAVAANDSDLLRFQQVERELTQANQKLAQDQQALGQSAQTTASASVQVAQSTQQTAQTVQQFGERLDQGMGSVQSAMGRLPDQIAGQTAQMVQAITSLEAALQNQSAAVHAAISNIAAQVTQLSIRVQGLSNSSYQ